MKSVRLLPAVIVVGFALLGVKGEGLVRSAWAQEQKVSAVSDVLAKDIAPVASERTADPRALAETFRAANPTLRVVACGNLAAALTAS